MTRHSRITRYIALRNMPTRKWGVCSLSQRNMFAYKVNIFYLDCRKTCEKPGIGTGALDNTTCTCQCLYGKGPNCDGEIWYFCHYRTLRFWMYISISMFFITLSDIWISDCFRFNWFFFLNQSLLIRHEVSFRDL